ncbi:predicted protein [Aspergillus nidulans FGSC A4]|uniref:Uncharacterized protein n=1 Tax=Emericella nidulans (strain FGSC A4 / ATCC 38163 / CBS 112.46 / NRRL 194 / M139) TaxID=227321 RepID=Q5B7A8_EMENI|nr:hypothetical protein [Aspergillus nidulans FGSC A4]EAA59780.1 predicted protein [Aspergillus nidulans FGSC A4]CBF75858.1 TPA: conserved hypothetical protein [Aspergillus nidulans FGSC A4]|eukprot:XP_661176.1 predicted protein [Aspergillus nidulans FGSC A4]
MNKHRLKVSDDSAGKKPYVGNSNNTRQVRSLKSDQPHFFALYLRLQISAQYSRFARAICIDWGAAKYVQGETQTKSKNGFEHQISMMFNMRLPSEGSFLLSKDDTLRLEPWGLGS